MESVKCVDSKTSARRGKQEKGIWLKRKNVLNLQGFLKKGLPMREGK